MSTKANKSTDKFAKELHRLIPEAHLTVAINDRDFDISEYVIQTIGKTYLVDAGSQHAIEIGLYPLLYEIGRSDSSQGMPFINACSDSEPENFDVLVQLWRVSFDEP